MITHTTIKDIDPRVKLWFSVQILVLISVINDYLYLLLIGILPFLLYSIMNGMFQFFKFMWNMKWYLIIFLIFGYFISGLSIYTIGIISLKFLLLFQAFTILSQTTTPDEITDTLLKLRLPSNFAWRVGMSLRQVYFLQDELGHLRRIQQLNSGYHLNRKNSRFSRIGDYLTTIYANAINRSVEFDKTLQIRGFKGAHREIVTYEANFQISDFIWLCILTFPSLLYLLLESSQIFN